MGTFSHDCYSYAQLETHRIILAFLLCDLSIFLSARKPELVSRPDFVFTSCNMKNRNNFQDTNLHEHLSISTYSRRKQKEFHFKMLTVLQRPCQFYSMIRRHRMRF